MKYILGFIAAIIVGLAFKGLSFLLKIEIDKFFQGWTCACVMFIVTEIYEAIADSDK
jgi:Na+/H+-dicarboxylate symporter